MPVLTPDTRLHASRQRQGLTKRSQFLLVQRRGRAYAGPFLALRALPNHLEVSRFGFSVGKGVGKAVVRNRTKRRLREIARQALVKPGWDLVLAARPAAATADFAALRSSAESLLRKAGLLQASSEEQPSGGG
ncbi:MAG: ribonuclease P protein component [Chloroflexi bacterium]|nr:ribonuclease P protein component [Chloroflexota bacterium]